MVLAARCKICGRIIEYTREDPGILGDHIMQFHPNTSVANFSCLAPDDSEFPVSRRPSVSTRPSEKRTDNIYKRPSTSKPSSTKMVTPRKVNASHIYKTTMETWKPGNTPVYCPKCCKDVIPTVRRQRNKISRTSCGALFMMGCWPICFLPFVMNCCGAAKRKNLYCPICCTYIGTYDRKKGLIQVESNKR